MVELAGHLFAHLADALARDPAASAAVLVNLTVLTAAGIELCWLQHRSPSPTRPREAAVAVACLTGSVPAAVVATWLTVTSAAWVGRLAPGPLVGFFAGAPALAVVCCFIAHDALGHAYHRLGHRTAVGWAAHRPHHTGRHFNLSLALRQSWFPVLFPPVFCLVALGGFPPATVALVVAGSNLLTAAQHSHRPWPAQRLVGVVLHTPATHRLHHRRGATTNLGPVLNIWDHLAGTFERPALPAPAPAGPVTGPVDAPTGEPPLGEDRGPGPTGPLGVQLDGWRHWRTSPTISASPRLGLHQRTR